MCYNQRQLINETLPSLLLECTVCLTLLWTSSKPLPATFNPLPVPSKPRGTIARKSVTFLRSADRNCNFGSISRKMTPSLPLLLVSVSCATGLPRTVHVSVVCTDKLQVTAARSLLLFRARSRGTLPHLRTGLQRAGASSP